VQLWVGAMIALALVGFAGQLASPDLGCDLSDGLETPTIQRVDRDGAAERAGVRAGDVAVADTLGLPPRAAWTEREFYDHARRLHRRFAERRVPLRVRRGESVIDMVVVPDAPRAAAASRALRRLAPMLVPFFAFAALAIALARRPARSSRADGDRRVAAAGLATFAVAFGPNFAQGGWPSWLLVHGILTVNLCAPIGLALLTAFVWRVPRSTSTSRSPLFAWGLALLALVAGGMSSLDGLGVVRAPLPGNSSQVMADTVLLVALVIGLLLQRRAARNAIERRQVDVLLAAFTFVMLLALVVLRFYTMDRPLILQLAFAGCAVIPAAFAVAVARYRLFSFDGHVIRTTIYVVVTASSLLVYVVVSTALASVFHSGPGEGPRWIALGVALGIAAPIRAATEALGDRMLHRDRALFIRRCFDVIARLRHVTRETLLDTIGAVLGAAEAVIVDVEDPSVAARGAVRVVELRDADVAASLLEGHVEILIHLPDARGVLGLAMPEGLAVIGEPERVALTSVGRSVATWLRQDDERRVLFARLTAGEDARRQIAMELHDGVGATLVAARVMAQLLKDGQGHEADTLHSLERTLGDGLADLRLTLHSLDERESSWADTMARLRRHLSDACEGAGLVLEFQCALGDAQPLPAVRLAVFRIAQEALTNTLRHATATNVRCVVAQHDGDVRLVFEDDGIGLVTRATGGRGLLNMQRRAHALGGSLVFERSTSGGLRIDMRLSCACGPSFA
jgi:two-component system sensor histidine kinase UhpB